MRQNVTNRLIILQMRIRVCVCAVCAVLYKGQKNLQKITHLKAAKGFLKWLVSGSPFNSQMTYLDIFMFAWRRIKKAVHSPLQAGYACQRGPRWKSSNLNAFVRGDLVDCSRQKDKLVVSSYNELGEALQFFCSQRSPDYSTVSRELLLVL